MKKLCLLLFSALLLTLIVIYFANVCPKEIASAKKGIVTGADQTHKYLPYLKGKRVAMVADQTSIIMTKLSVDSLLSLGVIIVRYSNLSTAFGEMRAAEHFDDH